MSSESGVLARGGLRHLIGRRRARRAELSAFEFWPDGVFYLPVTLYWLLLGLRHGHPLLPTCANPRIEAGGLCGESKSSILDQIAGVERGCVASYVAMAATGDAAADRAAATAAMAAGGLAFPVVAKPDIGCNGAGVKLIDGAAALAAYLAGFPTGERLLLQELVPFEGEAGVFYVRRPGERSGRITSLTFKSSPHVVGDGRSTLRALVLADERAGQVPQLYLPRLAGRLDEVPKAGERIRLVFVGNHCKGSIFRDGAAEITLALSERIDRIARSLPDFHFGRFDLRFRSLAEFRQGEGFRLIEVNGAGSEATHIWDRDMTIAGAYRAQFEHYRMAFEIGAANWRRGWRPTGVLALYRLWQRQKRLMASYPLAD